MLGMKLFQKMFQKSLEKLFKKNRKFFLFLFHFSVFSCFFWSLTFELMAEELILPGVYSVTGIVSVDDEVLTLSLSPNPNSDCHLSLTGSLAADFMRGEKSEIYNLKILITEKIYSCLPHELGVFSLSHQNSTPSSSSSFNVYVYSLLSRNI